MRKILVIALMVLAHGTVDAQISLNSDIVVTAQRSADGKQYKLQAGKHVPYANTAEFLSTVPTTRRHVGELAYVYGSNGAILTYQFVGGVADVNFKRYADTVGVAKSVTYAATSQSTFSVTLSERPYANYTVSVTPASAAAVPRFYVTNKTVTGFDIIAEEPITGTVVYDIIVIQ